MLKDAGYGVVAPDLLGYGDTDKPEVLEAYSMKRMSGHIAELLKKEGLEKVVGVAHDCPTRNRYPSRAFREEKNTVGRV